jgi:hypothetical protein
MNFKIMFSINKIKELPGLTVETTGVINSKASISDNFQPLYEPAKND